MARPIREGRARSSNRAEASAADRIGNPHIVETFDAGLLEDGSPYGVMEFLEGKPLNEVLRWSGRLDAGLA